MTYQKKELIERLLGFDQHARLVVGSSCENLNVVIVGGSAFVLSDLCVRRTHDIDVLSIPTELSDLMRRYDMNGAVSAYVDLLPYNYGDRLVRLDIGDTFLNYCTPSLEDLVVMKLYGMRPPDIEDLRSPEVLDGIDWDILEMLVYDNNEARASAMSERRYREMADAFEEYKRECKQ